jgi:hypothetical protein
VGPYSRRVYVQAGAWWASPARRSFSRRTDVQSRQAFTRAPIIGLQGRAIGPASAGAGGTETTEGLEDDHDT